MSASEYFKKQTHLLHSSNRFILSSVSYFRPTFAADLLHTQRCVQVNQLHLFLQQLPESSRLFPKGAAILSVTVDTQDPERRHGPIRRAYFIASRRNSVKLETRESSVKLWREICRQLPQEAPKNKPEEMRSETGKSSPIQTLQSKTQINLRGNLWTDVFSNTYFSFFCTPSSTTRQAFKVIHCST